MDRHHRIIIHSDNGWNSTIHFPIRLPCCLHHGRFATEFVSTPMCNLTLLAAVLYRHLMLEYRTSSDGIDFKNRALTWTKKQPLHVFGACLVHGDFAPLTRFSVLAQGGRYVCIASAMASHLGQSFLNLQYWLAAT